MTHVRSNVIYRWCHTLCRQSATSTGRIHRKWRIMGTWGWSVTQRSVTWRMWRDSSPWHTSRYSTERQMKNWSINHTLIMDIFNVENLNILFKLLNSAISCIVFVINFFLWYIPMLDCFISISVSQQTFHIHLKHDQRSKHHDHKTLVFEGFCLYVCCDMYHVCTICYVAELATGSRRSCQTSCSQRRVTSVLVLWSLVCMWVGMCISVYWPLL